MYIGRRYYNLKNGDQRITLSAELWHDGERRSINKTVKSEDEALLVEVEWRQKYGDAADRERAVTRMTLDQWVPMWLGIVESNEEVKQGSLSSYRWRLNKYVIPVLGKKPLMEIDAQMILAMLDGIKLSIGTKRDIKTALSRCLSAAVDRGYIKDNPCEKVKLRQSKAKKKSAGLGAVPKSKVWTSAEADKLIATGHPFVVLGLFGGLRRGEILGVHVEDVDFVEGTVHIHRNIVKDAEGAIYEDTPKSGETRTVYLAADAVTALARWVEETGVESGPFMNKRPDAANAWFNKLCRDVGVKQLNIHAMRHTCASLLISEGVNIGAIAAHLGHADPSITLRTYTHFLDKDTHKCSEALQRALGKVVMDLPGPEISAAEL